MPPDGPAPRSRAGNIEVRDLASGPTLAAALRLLDDAERAAGAPLVDEAERARLERATTDPTDRHPRWRALLAMADDRPVGYAGAVVNGHQATGDVAGPGDAGATSAVVRALLDALATVAADEDASRLQVWQRQTSEDDVSAAAAAGFDVARRLGVFGRDLSAIVAIEVPAGIAIRASRPEDADAIVAVLRAAYAGTPEGDWTRDAFDDRRGYDWFRHDDLLVAERDGRVVGLHWLKRRGHGVGEVYNLAVDPTAQAGGLGGALLDAGLRHLQNGCDEVILWADLANTRAVRLYEAHGFTLRWQDVAFERTVGG